MATPDMIPDVDEQFTDEQKLVFSVMAIAQAMGNEEGHTEEQILEGVRVFRNILHNVYKVEI